MSYNNPIYSDDPNAIQKLTKKLNACKELQEHMKAVNAYYRKTGSLKDCPDLSEQELAKLERRIAMRFVGSDVPYPSYELTGNSAEIRRLQQRIDELSKAQSQGFEGWEFDGGKAVANMDKRRLQLFFDEKPDEGKRTMLKRYGFRWTPTEGAWQRLLNDNAIYACDRIDFLRPTDGRRPTQLQPKAPRSTEQER